MQLSLFWQLHVSYLHLWRQSEAGSEGGNTQTHTCACTNMLSNLQRQPRRQGSTAGSAGAGAGATHLVILRGVHGCVALAEGGLCLLQQGAPVLGIVGCRGSRTSAGRPPSSSPPSPAAWPPRLERLCPRPHTGPAPPAQGKSHPSSGGAPPASPPSTSPDRVDSGVQAQPCP